MNGEALEMNDIETSETCGKLFEALAKAQAEIKGAAKDATNPHFRAQYADLASIVAASRAPLAKNGIAVVQVPYTDAENIGLMTILGHSSGEWIRGRIAVKPVKFDAQGAGSVLTYLRRYALAAMAGVAPDDDDGEAASGRGNGNGNGAQLAAPAAPPPRPTRQSVSDAIKAEADGVRADLEKAADVFALDTAMDLMRERIEKLPPATQDYMHKLYAKRRAAMLEVAA